MSRFTDNSMTLPCATPLGRSRYQRFKVEREHERERERARKRARERERERESARARARERERERGKSTGCEVYVRGRQVMGLREAKSADACLVTCRYVPNQGRELFVD